jgi:hypothetical protein
VPSEGEVIQKHAKQFLKQAVGVPCRNEAQRLERYLFDLELPPILLKFHCHNHGISPLKSFSVLYFTISPGLPTNWVFIQLLISKTITPAVNYLCPLNKLCAGIRAFLITPTNIVAFT